MEGITSILKSIVIAACTAVSTSTVGLSTIVALGKFKSVTAEDRVSVLNKSVSISKILDIEDGKFMAIPMARLLF